MMAQIPQSIVGRAYKYHPTRATIFVVKEVSEWIVVFECGHRVTDTVFMDMYDIKDRKYNYNIHPKLDL